MRELPLGARDLPPVALDRGGRRTADAQLLTLDDELGDPDGKRLDRVPVTAPPEARSAQGPESWAASHVLFIGAKTKEVNPHAMRRLRRVSASIARRCESKCRTSRRPKRKRTFSRFRWPREELRRKVGSEIDALLERLIEDGEIRGELGSVRLVHVDGKRVVVAGIGEAERADADALRTAAAAVVEEVGRFAESVAWVLDDSLSLPAEQQATAVVEGTLLGAYDPARWKRRPKRKLARADHARRSTRSTSRVQRTARQLRVGHPRGRDLVNSPPNETDARDARRAGERDRLSGRAPRGGRARARPDWRAGHGRVGRGRPGQPPRAAADRPALRPARAEAPDLVLGLVGKAITFDTGGISLKPSLHMEDMKGDMAGGAAVIEATGAIADLGLPVRVISVIASTENMPGGGAYRPGDILTAANGKTIEVINTDAEGRLVLADALWYARGQGATNVLDLATLTGAMEVALGDLYAGIFGNDDAWRDQVVEAGERERRPRLAVPDAPALPALRRLLLRRHEELSDLRQAGAVLAASSSRSSQATGAGRTSTSPGPPSSSARAATT